MPFWFKQLECGVERLYLSTPLTVVDTVAIHSQSSILKMLCFPVFDYWLTR